MALYNRDALNNDYGMVGRGLLKCTQCENDIHKRYQDKELTIDQAHKEIKELEGKLEGVKIGRIYNSATITYLCPNCIKKLYDYTKVEEKEVVAEVSAEVETEKVTKDAKESKKSK